MARLTQSQKRKVEKALQQHDKLSNAYFGTPPATANSRRWQEQSNTWSVTFKHGGHVYMYSSDVRCSCKNYYYSGEFSLDGEKKNRRLFANLLEKGAS